MNTDNMANFEAAHLEQWLETTRRYLFADRVSRTEATGKAPLESRLDSHGAQDRFISRARGKLLCLLKRAAQHDHGPLQELERTFHFQASFVVQHPEVPQRLLGWLAQGSDTRIRRRIQMVIGHYESRLCRVIGQAQHHGLIRADIDPQTAARTFIGMIQSLARRMNGNPSQRELLLRDALADFARYKAGMALPLQ
jgi:hypothetical protein